MDVCYCSCYCCYLIWACFCDSAVPLRDCNVTFVWSADHRSKKQQGRMISLPLQGNRLAGGKVTSRSLSWQLQCVAIGSKRPYPAGLYPCLIFEALSHATSNSKNALEGLKGVLPSHPKFPLTHLSSSPLPTLLWPWYVVHSLRSTKAFLLFAVAPDGAGWRAPARVGVQTSRERAMLMSAEIAGVLVLLVVSQWKPGSFQLMCMFVHVLFYACT